jgi:hypothetical protein
MLTDALITLVETAAPGASPRDLAHRLGRGWRRTLTAAMRAAYVRHAASGYRLTVHGRALLAAIRDAQRERERGARARR